jgi:hypothetical protein
VRSFEKPRLRSGGSVGDAGAGFDLGLHTRLDFHGGARDETDAVGQDRSLTWYGLGLDVLLGRRWYYTLAFDRTTGAEEDNDQLYSSLSFRF